MALEGEHTAFDAELSAIVETIELLIFTDSQAAMRRFQNDTPGLGQQLAIKGIKGPRCISQQDQRYSPAGYPAIQEPRVMSMQISTLEE